jgi:hypothetical protein
MTEIEKRKISEVAGRLNEIRLLLDKKYVTDVSGFKPGSELYVVYDVGKIIITGNITEVKI